MSMRKVLVSVGLCALPLVVACGGSTEPPASESAPAAAPKAPASAPGKTGSATVSGKIAFEGDVPEATTVKLSADPKCEHMHEGGEMERRPVEVTDGGLANVFVYVKSGVSGEYPPPSEAALLDQIGCNYEPHVVAVQAGQTLRIRNSDDTLHNVHPRPKVNEEFNFGQPRQGMENTHTFDKPEVMIPVGCDVHPWMRSYISVVGHPFFAVSAADGSFSIANLPAGEYEIEALHETLGSQSATVSVDDGGAATVDLSFTAG